MLYLDRAHKSILKMVGALLGLIFVGALGFRLIEGWSAVDSLYMTIITLSTVGFGEPRPMSEAGRIFVIFYIVTGVTVGTYWLRAFSKLLIEGEIQKALGRRRAMSRMKKTQNHYIICGLGRIGRMVATEFGKRGTPFIAIERDEEGVRKLPQDFPIIVGDATEEEVLREAGIERAKGLVTVLQTDAENLFITLSARELNPKLFIIARYEEERSRVKLIRAGADKVISPYIIGGTRMAMAAIRPAVIDFIELATQSESLGLQMEEIVIPPLSPLAGKSLVDSKIRSDFDIIIVAVKKRSGHMEFNPGASTIIEEGDRLVAIGDRAHLNVLEQMVAGGQGK
ncbi:potassium channel protein [bacterium]|nr:MAG: potassium channel protein [bacterium]